MHVMHSRTRCVLPSFVDLLFSAITAMQLGSSKFLHLLLIYYLLWALFVILKMKPIFIEGIFFVPSYTVVKKKKLSFLSHPMQVEV